MHFRHRRFVQFFILLSSLTTFSAMYYFHYKKRLNTTASVLPWSPQLAVNATTTLLPARSTTTAARHQTAIMTHENELSSSSMNVITTSHRQQRTSGDDSSCNDTSQRMAFPSIKQRLVVLSWNLHRWFSVKGLVNAANREKSCNLPPTNLKCLFVEDRDLYENADAILFRGDVMFPREFPRTRSLKQKWIYYSHETPAHTASYGGKYSLLVRQASSYNLTSTYSHNSDVPFPVSEEVCHVDPEAESEIATETGAHSTTTSKLMAELKSVVSNKSSLVAWFVSHCTTTSRREEYVRELRRYLPIDIYGKCGTLRCPLEIHNAEPYGRCDRSLLSKRYKFYLSFENSLCSDYITEKFFRIRHIDIVPIVLGVADYTRWTPPGTFIDVRHFRSPRHLADFIRKLDADDTQYINFLLRKRLAKCRPFSDGFAIGPYRERLCSHLHQNYDTIETADLRPLADPRKACLKPAEFYRNISSLRF